MCILNNSKKVAEQRQHMTILQLWKVISKDNSVGLWRETSVIYRGHQEEFYIGKQVAHDYHPQLDTGYGYEKSTVSGAFHCCFTRKAARSYLKYRADCGIGRGLKIIKIYADSCSVISVGIDKHHKISAISVSKMEIKSLKHQR